LLKPDHRRERKALSVRLLHKWSRAVVRFDEENLVSCAGLVPVTELAERAGMSELVAEKVEITGAPSSRLCTCVLQRGAVTARGCSPW
jgi:hypothetical protein